MSHSPQLTCPKMHENRSKDLPKQLSSQLHWSPQLPRASQTCIIKRFICCYKEHRWYLPALSDLPSVALSTLNFKNLLEGTKMLFSPPWWNHIIQLHTFKLLLASTDEGICKHRCSLENIDNMSIQAAIAHNHEKETPTKQQPHHLKDPRNTKISCINW